MPPLGTWFLDSAQNLLHRVLPVPCLSLSFDRYVLYTNPIRARPETEKDIRCQADPNALSRRRQTSPYIATRKNSSLFFISPCPVICTCHIRSRWPALVYLDVTPDVPCPDLFGIYTSKAPQSNCGRTADAPKDELPSSVVSWH